jgi:hypothetical protein
VQPSPNVRTFSNFLAGVTATSASNAWAVGSYQNGTAPDRTLIEHWNGRAWAIQPSPDLGTVNQLYGVTATSPSNAWAVGFYQSGTAPDRTLIEHWNGRAWAIQPSPNGGTGFSDLYGVAATSAANAWAVGRGPHDLAITPDGKNLYVITVGGDTIGQYRINPATGALSAKPASTAATVLHPEAIALAPDGKNAYVTSGNDRVLSQFAISPTTGKITPLPPATVITLPSGSLGLAVTSAK